MYKIKLLILLLISALLGLNGCTNKETIQKNKYKLSYISGDTDGLLFSNLLRSHLKISDLYDEKSNLEIKATISHSQNLFITNIDNTSDREKITSSMTIEVNDLTQKCKIFEYFDDMEQFYIITSSVNYTSNKKALEQIKSQNDEILITNLLPKLFRLDPSCI